MFSEFFALRHWAIVVVAVILGLATSYHLSRAEELTAKTKASWWPMQSIDTMKYSRDVAREKLNDADFLVEIDRQVKDIAATGATHVAVGTPYDEEFLPFLRQWVIAARRYGLNVWFRGNWSGWEKWFGYPKISREEHLQKTKAFISGNKQLFADGDIFSPCPECENGGPGDPRKTRDVAGHRQFLISLTQTCDQAFQQIKKQVACNYHSMNGDVARLVMDETTTKAVGGLVVIDHYVKSPEKLVTDIQDLAEQSQGQIILGEFGAPIPDIHGQMSVGQQSAWIGEALKQLSVMPQVVGVNYWTNKGSSTQLWNGDQTPRPVVAVLQQVYRPQVAKGIVMDQFKLPVKEAKITNQLQTAYTDSRGKFEIVYLPWLTKFDVSADGYSREFMEATAEADLQIKLEKLSPEWWSRLWEWLQWLIQPR